MGVSRTRFLEATPQPAGHAVDVATGADVDTGQPHVVAVLQFGQQRLTHGIHHAKGLCVGGNTPLGDDGSSAGHECIAQRRIGRRRGACFGDGVADCGLDRRIDILTLRSQAIVIEQVSAARHGIRLEPSRVHIGVAVARLITFVVPVPAVGVGFDEKRAFAGAQAGDEVSCGRGHRENIVAVDRRALESVAMRSLDHGHSMLGSRFGELCVMVVLAEEQNRQAPEAGEVHRLVECARRDRAVAEERHHHVVTAAQPHRLRDAGRDRQARPDDAVRAEDSAADIRDMHRAAEPATGAGGPTHQLREHPHRVGAFRKAVPVTAVRRDDAIGNAQRPGRADRSRFLPERDVHEARHFAIAIQLRRALFESPNNEHSAIEVEHLVFGESAQQSRSTLSRR